MRHRDRAVVHVGHQGLQHLHLDVIQNEDRVTTRVVLQDLLEVRTAGGQDHLVTLQWREILEKNCIPK